MRKRVDRGVESEKPLEHRGEQEDTAPDELRLVELDGDLDAPDEARGRRDEADGRPLAFCPQCAAKIWWATQSDPRDYYRRLAEFCKRNKLAEEAKFYNNSAAALTAQK